VVSTHGEASSCSNSKTERNLPENRPEGEEQDRIGQERQDHTERNLHLSLSLEFILDQPGPEDTNDIDGHMGDEWEEEKR
jgi:hypothetical protein